MANSFTALGFIKPEVGADTNLWGGHWNANADLFDALAQRFVGTTTTRILQFNVDAVSTTTTRTITWRDISGTVALTSDAPRSYLAGLTLSAAGGTGTFGIAAGSAADSTNVSTMTLASAYTKTTAAWAVGSGNGGLDTGAIANNTWYHAYEIQRPDTGVVDATFSLNATTPGLPANYTLFRRLGAMKTDGSAQWIAFTQTGDLFQWATQILDVNLAAAVAGTTATTVSVPLGIAVFWQGTGRVVGATAQGNVLVQLFTPGTTANASTASLSLNNPSNLIAGEQSGMFSILTNTSSQISRAGQGFGGATGVLSLATIGWIDRRGRDA